jgi:hypothetical protein
MKNFNEWLEGREINEITTDLLGRASAVARGRGDERGERLADKFQGAIKDKTNDNRVKESNAFDNLPNLVDANLDNSYLPDKRMVKLNITQARGNVHNMNGGEYSPFWNLAGMFKFVNVTGYLESELRYFMLRLEKRNEKDPVYTVLFSEYHSQPNISSFEEKGKTKIIGFDRRSAMIVAKFINRNGGDIKPTELPLMSFSGVNRSLSGKPNNDDGMTLEPSFR